MLALARSRRYRQSVLELYLIDDGDADGWIDLFVDRVLPGLNRFEGPEGLRNICD